MKRLIVVTGNKDKFREISLVLKEFGIEPVMKGIKLDEVGDTLEEVAMRKVNEAYGKLRRPLIVDDTGIFFKAYRNFPGIYAKRIYLGIGFQGLLKLLENKSREAYFRSVVCYCDGKCRIFSGELHGSIQRKVYRDKFSRGKFPYERIFIPEGMKKPISLMPLQKKIKFSHRAIAVRKFARWLTLTRQSW